MPTSDIKELINKDPIIFTYNIEDLKRNPAGCQQAYQVYARTHVSLGDTEKYVDSIFRWVGGANQGAFVGAVVGENGQGKTSFQVHIWEQSVERGVLAVPPFSWTT